MINYYLQNDNQNISYQAFQFGQSKNTITTTPSPNIIYIGLIGEFVGEGKHLSQREKPSNFTLLNELSIDGEIVFDYGNNLWIGKFN